MYDAHDAGGRGGGFWESLWIPDGALLERNTRGAAYGTREYPNNLANFDIHSFDGYIEEAAHWQEVMDEWWDLNPVRAKVYYTMAGTPTTGGNTDDDIVWGVRMLALNDTNAIDVAFGPEVLVGDNVQPGQQAHITEATPLISTQNANLARSPIVVFQVARKVEEENGNFINLDAQCWGVYVQYFRQYSAPAEWTSQVPA